MRRHLFPKRRRPQTWHDWFWPLPIGTVLAIACTFFWLRPDIEIDSCLDAGGSYDYVAKTCEVDCNRERWKDGPLEGWRCAPAMTEEQAKTYFRQLGTEVDCGHPEQLSEINRLLCKADAVPRRPE